MQKINGIVFDMDGILLDSESVSDITWEKAAKDFNIQMSMDILNSCRGSNKQDIIIILKNHYGNDFPADQFLNKTGEYFWKIDEKQGIPLMPYAKEILDYLSPKYKIALASSTRGVSVTKHLTKTGLIKYFDLRVTGDMVEHSKPNPDIYLKACDLLNLKPEECVAVEDSFNGIRSASSAGLLPIMVPDRVMPTDEIKSLCWKICKTLEGLKKLL